MTLPAVSTPNISELVDAESTPSVIKKKVPSNKSVKARTSDKDKKPAVSEVPHPLVASVIQVVTTSSKKKRSPKRSESPLVQKRKRRSSESIQEKYESTSRKASNRQSYTRKRSSSREPRRRSRSRSRSPRRKNHETRDAPRRNETETVKRPATSSIRSEVVRNRSPPSLQDRKGTRDKKRFEVKPTTLMSSQPIRISSSIT